MGYEIMCLYGMWHQDQSFFEEVGRVDLCKIGEGPMMRLVALSHQTQHSEPADSHSMYGPVEVYYDSHDETTKEDRYGDKIWLLDVPEVILALKKELNKEKYRRYDIALAALEKFYEHFKLEQNEHSVPGVILFGH